MISLSLTYQLNPWEENPGPLKGTTTPKVHAKQLWCTLGVVVLLELSISWSLKVFVSKGKSQYWHGLQHRDHLYSPYFVLAITFPYDTMY